MNTKTLPITVQASDIEGIGHTTYWPDENNGNTAIIMSHDDGGIHIQLMFLRRRSCAALRRPRKGRSHERAPSRAVVHPPDAHGGGPRRSEPCSSEETA